MADRNTRIRRGQLGDDIVEPSDLDAINSPATGKVPKVDTSGQFVWVDLAGGGGDMLKSQYDTDNDGIVDKAEAIDDGISGDAHKSTAAQVRDAVDKKHTQNTDISIKDADGDTSINVEETTDADTIVGKVGGTEVLRFHSSGIINFSKQSACAGYLSANQTIASGDSNISKINFDTKEFDVQNEFNTTNHRFTASKAGKYLICGQIGWCTACVDSVRVQFSIRKNGSPIKAVDNAEPWYYTRQTLAVMLDLAANDYIEFFAGQWSTANYYLQSGILATYFSISKVI